MTGASTRQWRLTAVEFDLLWRLYGRDRLPYPMQVRGTADTAAGHRCARRDAARRIGAVLDEELHATLSVLLDPVVRIEVCGFQGAGPASVTRLHAGVGGGRGVVARQLPGVDLDSGGDVLVETVPDARVAGTIVAGLPAVPRGAGRGVVPNRSGGTSAAGSLLRPVGGRDHEEDLRVFLARPRAGVGEIGVHPGPAVDWRPTGDGAVVHWMDFADGRYLVRGGGSAPGGETEQVLPVSGEELAAHLRTLIGRTG